MNPTQTTQLLTYIAGLDPRMAARDDTDAKARVLSWSRLLADADHATAMTTVERYYRDPANTYPITVNVIAGACRPGPKWEGRAEHHALAGRAVPMPDEVRAHLRRPDDHHARSVPCPWKPCHAPAGQACTVDGRPLTGGRSHPARAEAAHQPT